MRVNPLLFLLLSISLSKWTVAKFIESSSLDQGASLSFDILHINDIHAHFDEISGSSGRCSSEQKACYGGLPRLFKAISELRSGSEKKSLLLNAGDYYQGSIWYAKFKYEVVLEFANMLNYTAMSLGNHEFDDDLKGIEPFVNGANFPVLACNIIDKQTGLPKFETFTIDESLGEKIGIIGYVSKDTPIITSADVGSVLNFTDEISCIREEAQKLKEQGVSIIIALGHSGYEIDLEIAKQVEEIDIVVGGHSHTFLYPEGESQPLEEKIDGDYPTYVTQESGRVVPVVQAYCFSKYLGQFRVNFDEHGELLEPVDGKGVSLAKVHLLDQEKDSLVIAKMKPYKENLSEYYVKIGETSVDLKGSFMKESNLGNFVADSLVFGAGRPGAIAFVNNGGLRSDIGKGEIILEDLVTTLPFNNKICIFSMKGSSIKKIFEGLASKWGRNSYSTFLQVSSAVKLEFLIKDDNIGSRLTSARIKCSKEGKWCDLEDDKEYEVILPSFIANGGFPSPNFNDLAISKENTDKLDYIVLQEYIKQMSPISISLEDRITIVENSGSTSSLLKSSGLWILISTFILKFAS